MNLRHIFPEINANISAKDQLEKVLEEHAEVLTEIKRNNREFQLYESVDLIVASCNVLYKAGYSDEEITRAIDLVRLKMYKKGYISL